MCLLLLALIVVDRARLLDAFGLRFTDEDQSVLWLTAQDLRHGRLFAPYFYGQSYAGWLEALVAVPLLTAGMSLRTAVPVAATVVGALPCLLLAATAWRRRAPLTAAVVLCGFLLLTTEAVAFSSMPRGLTGGILLATVAVVLILGRDDDEAPRPWSVAAFALLAVVGVSLNQSSLLLSAPAAAYLLVRHRCRRRVWLWAAVGAGCGIVLHALAQSFYDARPAYAFHPAWPLELRRAVLDRSLQHLGDYLAPYSLAVVRTPALPLAALAVAVGLLAARRGLAGIAAGLIAATGLAASLALPKAIDGTSSVFLPYFRLHLVVPAMLAYLAVQSVTGERVRPWVNRLAGTGLLVVAVAGVAWRQSQLPAEVARLTGARVTPGPGTTDTVNGGTSTAAVLERCRTTGELAAVLDAGLVVYATDRVTSYLCGAELYGRVDTLFPSYERRAWRLAEEATRARSTMLVAGADPRLCERARPLVPSCHFVDARVGMAVLRFPPQPVLPLVERLGIEVRPFGLRVDGLDPP